MYAITGITGKVGGEAARALLTKGEGVRAVLRDPKKGAEWAALGCEVSVADMEDAAALTEAFRGMAGVFILPPPVFDPQPGYIEARKVVDAVVAALKAAQPLKVVHLSTIGGDATEDNLLSQQTLMEQALAGIDLPVTTVRAGWFMDNAAWDVASAREGVVYSFLQPADRKVTMVAAQDVGRTAAELLAENWTGRRLVELEGPGRVSPNDIAEAFGQTLGHAVKVEIVARDTWEELFRSQGMQNPMPRIRMLDGFNEGWIAFRNGGAYSRKAVTDIRQVIASLVAKA
ncbi:NmrA family NAD(P)-binding protein [Rhizobium sp. XQZ8]|uniref:NmrA family NAD(P)-binding protein n=1 Tax=Rhizobium populisoli TaxID=2859785 RepID=UPI001CA5E024|nr:NmrA family NAD(P)-binding protein [Rhizobium populisoli]MBW6424613.1 NmrA family NAD(P)-binding protein [Rhizobium populisoli]